ncbi:hypothetical protein [Oceanithermus sp.]
MRRLLGLALLALGSLALAHAGDFAVENLRIVTTPEGTFLEGQIVYPAWDDPLDLEIVATDRGEGVLELREDGAWRTASRIPIPYGVTNFGATTPMRIRLTGGPYRPGEEVPVTFLFPAGALITAPARVERGGQTAAVAAALLLAAGAGALWGFRNRRHAAPGSPARSQ